MNSQNSFLIHSQTLQLNQTALQSQSQITKSASKNLSEVRLHQRSSLQFHNSNLGGNLNTTSVHTAQATTKRSFINRVIRLTNNIRRQAGLTLFKANPKLNRAAQAHSKDMALNDFFAHTTPTNSTMVDRIRAQGYNYSAAAENIAAGYATPKAVVDGWMNSPGHRTNILNPLLKQIGVGFYFLQNDTGSVNYQSYWTQNFGTPMK